MMEVDSMHSSIENAKRHVPVFSVHDWITIFKTARSNRNRNKNKKPYIVEELSYKDFVDLQKLSAILIKNKTFDVHRNQIKWLKSYNTFQRQENGLDLWVRAEPRDLVQLWREHRNLVKTPGVIEALGPMHEALIRWGL